MKNWIKKATTIAASATLMIPATSAFAEETPKTENNPELVSSSLGISREQSLTRFKDEKEWISQDTIIVKHSGLDKNTHKKISSKVIRSLPSLGYEVIQLNKGVTLEEAVSYYAKQKGVKSVSPSYVYHSFNTNVDPKKEEMYHLNLLQIDKALELAGNHEVKVAVIDNGIDFKHPDLSAQLLPSYNAAAPANSTSLGDHGTHVAGIIGAIKDNAIGGHGINPKAKLLPIDVFNGKSGALDFVIAQGILYAIEQDVDVINMSLGGYGESPLMKDAVKKAIEHGITIVAAAGNESTDDYSFPASFEGVISVGSTNDKNKLSSYSNYGPSVDLVAPGEDIYSTVYDVQKGTTFIKASGTSMASPVVAGVASLLKSKYPNLKPYEIEAILEMTSKDLGERGYDLTYGNGLVDPVKALQFDLKNLPKQYSETKAERMKNAKPLEKDILNTEKGEFKQPDEKKWYKVELTTNEYAQLTLKGADNYDYAMDLYFYPDKNKEKIEPIYVNEVRAGKEEGYLYKADQKGTLLIGVKDHNGSYNLNGKSNYTFTAQMTLELPVDLLDRDNLENIQQFPFTTSGKNYTLLSANQQSDQDYFTFTVKEPTTLKFDLSGIPGVTASMELYLKEDFDILPTEEVEEDLYWGYYMQASYGADKGDDVSMIVDAVPDQEYVLSISNENSMDFYMDMFLSGGIENEERISESIIPYTLKGEVITLPIDEDGLPLSEIMLEDNIEEELLPIEQSKIKERQKTSSIMDMIMSLDTFENLDEVDLIMEHAIRFEIGENQKAYFQTQFDEDYFLFNAKEDAIYSFHLQNGLNQRLYGTLYEYDEETNELLPVSTLTHGYEFLSLLLGSSSNDNEPKTIALKKDKTYVIKAENYGERSTEPYILKTSKLADLPKDNSRENNSPLGALSIKPGTVYTDYLVYPDDTDYYYYKQQNKDEIISLLISSIPYTNEELNQLPKELQQDLNFYGTIIEDTNGNMQIDPNEVEKEIPFGQLIELLLGSYGTTDVNTSFKARKNYGYFILVNGLKVDQVSIQPYSLTLFNHNRVDEDAGSKLVNGIPTKPIKLTKKDGKWVAMQYLNSGVPFGDKDYFELINDGKRNLLFSLQTEKALDGVIRIIDAKGKTVKTLDLYGTGDTEVGTVELDKGTYYIEVSEFNGKASTQPYTLEIN